MCADICRGYSILFSVPATVSSLQVDVTGSSDCSKHLQVPLACVSIFGMPKTLEVDENERNCVPDRRGILLSGRVDPTPSSGFVKS